MARGWKKVARGGFGLRSLRSRTAVQLQWHDWEAEAKQFDD